MPLLIANSGGTDSIYSIPEDTANGQTAVENGNFELPSGLGIPQSVAISGDSILVSDASGHEIFFVPADTAFGTTAVETKKIFYPNNDIGTVTAMAVHGSNILLGTLFTPSIYVIALNTVDDATATVSQTISAGLGSSVNGFAIDGDTLYINDENGITVFDLTNNTALRSFNRPSGITDVRGIAVNGNSLYLANNANDSITEVAADTANGVAATAVKTFTLPSNLLSPFGMAFYTESSTPSFSESSYAFTDVAIAVGTVVGTVVATDADNDTLSYSLTGTDASDFAIDADGEITVVTELTHSDTYSFNVVADDDTDTTSVAVTVTATAAPTPPTFTAPASAYAVDERANATIDSTEFFSGHSSLDFDEDYTAPSWITISGLNVVVTNAPSVTDDTDFTVELTATNDDGDVDGTITAQVNQIDPAPVIGTLSRIDINEGESDTVDLSGDLQNTDTLVITSGESWVSVSGLSLVITTAPDVTADTDYTINLRAESDETSATDTGSVVIRVEADVALSIETLDEQALTLDTDYDIEVEITGDPDEVTAEGKWDGWYYNWDAANDLLTISGNANTILSDAMWELTATKGAQVVEEDVTYSVAPPAPVITEPTNLTITAGTDYEANPIAIAIANSPSVIRMEGLLVGLYFESTDTGADIKGLLPSDVELTVTSGTLEIYASNGGGEDTVTPAFTIN